MKVNLNTEIIDIENGKPLMDKNLVDSFNKALVKYSNGDITNIDNFIKEVNEEEGNILTVGIVFRRGLLNQVPDSKEAVPAEEAQRRFLIAQEMMKGGEYDLKEKDRDIIKQTIPKLFTIQVVGQTLNALNTPAKKV